MSIKLNTLQMRRETRFAWLAALLAVLLILAMIIPVFAQSGGKQSSTPGAHQGSHKLSAQDREFLETAAQADMAEIVIAQVGIERAEHPKVRELAEHVLRDHRDANLELRKLSQQLPAELPVKPHGLTAGLASELGELEGAAFDRRFVEVMQDEHRKAVKAHTREVLDGQHIEVRRYAAASLPVLTRHFLQTVQVDQQLTQPQPQG